VTKNRDSEKKAKLVKLNEECYYKVCFRVSWLLEELKVKKQRIP
jgi:hypothetical protein